MFGPAANCINCKFLSSQIFLNSKKERICADCLQKEYDVSCAVLDKAFEDLQNATKKNTELEQKIIVYDAILEQIKNFTQLVKKE